MNVRTFTAASMAAALVQVRNALGGGAVVLHTRTVKRGGVLGLGARTLVEVIAADAREVSEERRKQRQRAEREARERALASGAATRSGAGLGSSSSASLPTAAGAGGAIGVRTPAAATRALPAAREAVAREPVSREPVPTAGELIRQTYAVARADFERERVTSSRREAGRGEPGREESEMPAEPVASPVAVGAPGRARSSSSESPMPMAITVGADQLQREVELVKRMVAQMLRQQREQAVATGPAGKRKAGAPVVDLPEPLFDQYLALLQQEVSESLADEIVRRVRGALSPERLAEPEALREAMLDAIEAHLPPADDEAVSLPTAGVGGRPRVIALIGPTGVGKTTTVAKLAANLKLKQKKRVGLITVDTYRIAAVEQLRTYAQIIGIPLHVAGNEAEMEEACGRCAGCDAVLIDTAGRSPRDDPRLGQLDAVLRAARADEVHLVLSATSAPSVVLDAAEKFSKIRFDRVVFSKLDEAVTYGVLLSVSRKIKASLSYVTTGQEVPHHIERGSPRRLAHLLMGGRI